MGSLISDSECWKSLEAAELRDAIELLPGQLDYKFNANGDGLSAGQKQRLSLARALANQPSILILDEPTANLDAETESALACTLSRLKGRVTSVIVSHRLGAIKYADQTIDLNSQSY